MRVIKILSVAAILTLLALLYVWQQTEIFRLAYTGQKKAVIFEDLLDKNTLLRYNIERNISLTRIGNKIALEKDFQMPDTYRLVRVIETRQTLRAGQQLPKQENIFSRLFGIKRQAEAKTINP